MSTTEPLRKRIGWKGYEVSLVVERRDGRYECTKLEVAPALQDGPEVRGEAFRSMPINRWVRETVAESGVNTEPALTVRNFSELVAGVYNAAYERREPPKQAVADAFSVSPSTASRMIRRARSEGFPIPVSKGGRP